MALNGEGVRAAETPAGRSSGVPSSSAHVSEPFCYLLCTLAHDQTGRSVGPEFLPQVHVLRSRKPPTLRASH